MVIYIGCVLMGLAIGLVIGTIVTGGQGKDKPNVLAWVVGAACVGVALAAGFGVYIDHVCPDSSASALCDGVSKSPPWLLFSGLAAGPSVLLTWAWRTRDKTRELDARESELEEKINARVGAQVDSIFSESRLARARVSTIVGHIVEELNKHRIAKAPHVRIDAFPPLQLLPSAVTEVKSHFSTWASQSAGGQVHAILDNTVRGNGTIPVHQLYNLLVEVEAYFGLQEPGAARASTPPDGTPPGTPPPASR